MFTNFFEIAELSIDESIYVYWHLIPFLIGIGLMFLCIPLILLHDSVIFWRKSNKWLGKIIIFLPVISYFAGLMVVSLTLLNLLLESLLLEFLLAILGLLSLIFCIIIFIGIITPEDSISGPNWTQ